ncbi:MAG: enoyl-CoA hydratase/isomerase family protein [Acidimicrobiales bacterium]
MSDPNVLVERHDGWASLTLNRPHRKNAIIGPLYDELADALNDLSADETVAAIVLSGAGGAFSSGIDLTELQADPRPAWVPNMSSSTNAAHMALYNCQCPIIAAVERYTINASTSLALACDVLVAGESAFMQIGEIRQGSGIPMNAAWMSLKASEFVLARLAYYGDRVPAARMHELGVVQEVVPDDHVLAVAQAHAERMAGYKPGASRSIKAAITARRTIDPQTWFEAPKSNALLNAQQVRD